MNEERKRILDMLSDGKINAQEAEELISALDQGEVSTSPRKKAKSRFLRIKITEDGENKVNVNIPLSLAKMFMKFVPGDVKTKLNEKDIDLNDIISEIEDGAPAGKLVEIEDEGDRVDIFLD